MKNTNNYLSIFLVDDDAIFLTALKHKLQEKFKSVIKINTFSGAEECLNHIGEKPDVVVLDYYLDEDSLESMNGIEVLRKIKKISDGTTVVMLSGQGKKEVMEESLRSGASQYVAKSAHAMGVVQNLLNGIVHNHIQERNARENVKLNYITTAIFLAFSGILMFFYLKYH